MKYTVRVNSKPLEDYLNRLVQELETLGSSSMAQEVLKQDLSHRAIWIEPSNNVSKLIDIDMALDSDLDEWSINLTLNPVNIYDKQAEIRNRFESRWERDSIFSREEDR